jgi:hypothetical protein
MYCRTFSIARAFAVNKTDDVGRVVSHQAIGTRCAPGALSGKAYEGRATGAAAALNGKPNQARVHAARCLRLRCPIGT